MLWSVIIATILSCVPRAVTAQNDVFEGSITLFSNGVKSNDGSGVLQVYTQNNWNIVCYELNGERVTNKEAATAACRQLGYPGYFRYGTTAMSMDYDQPKNLHSKAITGIHCPTVRHPETEGEVFLMRCDSSTQLIDSSNCSSIVAIQCEPTNLNWPYNGQVRVANKSPPGPILQIHFDGEWRPACINSALNWDQPHMNTIVAHSACRQMGYTVVGSFKSSLYSNVKSWKINKLSTNCTRGSSYPCFTDCVDQSFGYTSVDSCEEDNKIYELVCNFTKSDQVLYSAGNQLFCQYSSASPDVRFYSVTGGLSLLIVIFLVVIIVQWCRYRRRRPPAGAGDNPAPARPNVVVQWWRERGGNYGAVHDQREN